jgi:hypothetical protein
MTRRKGYVLKTLKKAMPLFIRVQHQLANAPNEKKSNHPNRYSLLLIIFTRE